MKYSITLLFIITSKVIIAQDVLNPYINYDYSQYGNYPDWPLNNSISSYQYSHYTNHQNPGYTGEYEIDIATLQNNIWNINFPNLLKTYTIEAVSFPFSMPCAFNTTGCLGNSGRNLYMPEFHLACPVHSTPQVA